MGHNGFGIHVESNTVVYGFNALETTWKSN